MDMKIRYPRNIHFECQRCAICCGDSSHRSRDILAMEPEVGMISRKTGLRFQSFTSRSPGPDPYRLKIKKRNGKCFFLDGKACRIYDCRPLVCRFYPFHLRKGNGRHVFGASQECPGIGLGGKMSQVEFEGMLEMAHKAGASRV